RPAAAVAARGCAGRQRRRGGHPPGAGVAAAAAPARHPGGAFWLAVAGAVIGGTGLGLRAAARGGLATGRLSRWPGAARDLFRQHIASFLSLALERPSRRGRRPTSRETIRHGRDGTLTTTGTSAGARKASVSSSRPGVRRPPARRGTR